MARPLPRPRHTPRCKCVVCARARGRAQNPFALGAAFAGFLHYIGIGRNTVNDEEEEEAEHEAKKIEEEQRP